MKTENEIFKGASRQDITLLSRSNATVSKCLSMARDNRFFSYEQFLIYTILKLTEQNNEIMEMFKSHLTTCVNPVKVIR